MKVLILGGTRFLGRQIVQEALQRGHEVTLFNRGNNAHLFPEVETLLGDRNGELDVLKGRKWDAVIDTCGLLPKSISQAAKVLEENISHYTYISSISVYKDWIPLHITEDYPTHTLLPEEVEAISNQSQEEMLEHYGALKALCEAEAAKEMPGKVLAVRAGMIVGPYDYTDRLPYWVKRVAEGGRILCPGNPNRPVQIIDTKDMASWILTMAQKQKTGTFNVTGPHPAITMGELLESCKQVTKSDAEFVWVQEEFLLHHHVSPWVEIPLWLPENHPLPEERIPWKGTFSFSVEKAVENDLTFRPLQEIIQDIWEWEQTRSDEKRKAGISREKERELLELWGNITTH
ncbi:SDR family oxidoreductase [Microbacteriaceae bacterium 4G12]